MPWGPAQDSAIPSELTACSAALDDGRFEEALSLGRYVLGLVPEGSTDRSESWRAIEAGGRLYVGIALGALDRFDQSLPEVTASLELLRSLARTSDTDLLTVRAHHALSIVLLRLGRLDDCLRHTAEVLDSIPDYSPYTMTSFQVVRAQTTLCRMACLMKLQRYAEAAADGVRVVKAFEAARAAELHAAASSNLATCLLKLGNAKKAAAVARRVLARIRRRPRLYSLSTVLHVADTYAGAQKDLGRPERGISAWEYAVSFARTAPATNRSALDLADALIHLANARNDSGRAAEALPPLDEAEPLLRRVDESLRAGRDEILLFAIAVRAEYHELIGEPGTAIALIDEALSRSATMFGPGSMPPYIPQIRERRESLLARSA